MFKVDSLLVDILVAAPTESLVTVLTLEGFLVEVYRVLVPDNSSTRYHL